jgi:hypothetical protein
MGGKRIADQVRRAIVATAIVPAMVAVLACAESGATDVRDGGSPVRPSADASGDARGPIPSDAPHVCRQLCLPSQGCRFSESCSSCACPDGYACFPAWDYCIQEGAPIWGRDASPDGRG